MARMFVRSETSWIAPVTDTMLRACSVRSVNRAASRDALSAALSTSVTRWLIPSPVTAFFVRMPSIIWSMRSEFPDVVSLVARISSKAATMDERLDPIPFRLWLMMSRECTVTALRTTLLLYPLTKRLIASDSFSKMASASFMGHQPL